MSLQSTIDPFITRSSSNPNISFSKRTADSEIDQWRFPKRFARNANRPSGVPSTPATSNRFQGLTADQAHDADPTSAPLREASRKKSSRIPPIILEMKEDWTHAIVMDLITKFTKGFHLQYRGKNKVAVVCYSPEGHQKIKEGLVSENTPFLTYTRKDEKKPKAVIRGLPSYVEEQLPDELSRLGFVGALVTVLKTKNNTPCPPFLIQLPAGANILQFRQIKYLCNCVVSIQKYRPNNELGTQCYRCQAFGHSSKNCNMPPRCVKCTIPHASKDCAKKDRTEPALCCNCNESHPANYRLCPSRIKYVESLRKKRVEQHEANQALSLKTRQKTKLADGRIWSSLFPGSGDQHRAAPPAEDEIPGLQSKIAKVTDTPQDEAITEMLHILTTLRTIKKEFTSCKSMMDKVILILSHLGQHV